MKCSAGLAGLFLKGHSALALAGRFLKGYSAGDGRLGLIGVEVTVQGKMSLCAIVLHSLQPWSSLSVQ